MAHDRLRITTFRTHSHTLSRTRERESIVAVVKTVSVAKLTTTQTKCGSERIVSLIAKLRYDNVSEVNPMLCKHHQNVVRESRNNKL